MAIATTDRAVDLAIAADHDGTILYLLTATLHPDGPGARPNTGWGPVDILGPVAPEFVAESDLGPITIRHTAYDVGPLRPERIDLSRADTGGNPIGPRIGLGPEPLLLPPDDGSAPYPTGCTVRILDQQVPLADGAVLRAVAVIGWPNGMCLFTRATADCAEFPGPFEISAPPEPGSRGWRWSGRSGYPIGADWVFCDIFRAAAPHPLPRHLILDRPERRHTLGLSGRRCPEASHGQRRGA